MSVSIRFVVIAFGAAALAFALGCGQPPEDEKAATPSKASPTPSGAAVNVNPRVVRSTELPANFPKDIPQHPEATVVESRATSDLGMSVIVVVKDDPDEVISYYADGLAAKGWSTDIRNMPDGSAVFADKEKRTAAVMVTETRRGSEVRILLGNQ